MKKNLKILITIILSAIIILLTLFFYNKYIKNDKTLSQNETKKATKKTTKILVDESSNNEDLSDKEQEVNNEEAENKKVDVKELTLVGEKEITIKLNSKYKELGAKAIDTSSNDISDQIEIHSTVDTTKKGEYKVYYSIGNYITVRYVTVE